MLFPARRDGHHAVRMSREPGPGQRRGPSSSPVTPSCPCRPVQLLSGVLGRLSRALAASARFSLDRFSDVYLVTDAIAAHGAAAANGPRIGFSIKAGGRRLELIVGPFRKGSGEQLRRERTPMAPARRSRCSPTNLRSSPSDGGRDAAAGHDRPSPLAGRLDPRPGRSIAQLPLINSAGESANRSRSSTPVRLSRRWTCCGPRTRPNCLPASSAR